MCTTWETEQLANSETGEWWALGSPPRCETPYKPQE